MIFFKNPNTGSVAAFETDAEREQWGAPELVKMTDAEVAAHLNPPLSQEAIIAAFTKQIQARLDAWACTRNYDGILSACTYATSTVPKFAAEGQRAVDLRDQTWSAAYTILDDVLANRRSMPTSIADIEDDLPALEWPA